MSLCNGLMRKGRKGHGVRTHLPQCKTLEESEDSKLEKSKVSEGLPKEGDPSGAVPRIFGHQPMMNSALHSGLGRFSILTDDGFSI